MCPPTFKAQQTPRLTGSCGHGSETPCEQLLLSKGKDACGFEVLASKSLEVTFSLRGEGRADPEWHRSSLVTDVPAPWDSGRVLAVKEVQA